MRSALLLTISLAAAACSSDGSIAAARYAQGVSETILLWRSNTAELDGLSDAVALVEVVDGNTQVTLVADPSWPIVNGFQGFVDFYYGAANPILHVVDQDCSEDVVAGSACGWQVNFDGTNADGFGAFASHSTQGGGGAGAGLLVFTIQGTPALASNDHGARIATHVQFAGDCSGWLSDGTATAVTANPACLPVVAPSCAIALSPAELVIAHGSSRTILVTTTATGAGSLSLGIAPAIPPPGFGFAFVPNPVTPPETSQLNITIAPDAEEGSTTLAVTGAGDGASCEASLQIDVLERPGCGCE